MNDYSNFSSINRHEYTEIEMSQRIKYKVAIDLFVKFSNTNEKISEAYKNFIDNQNRNFDEIEDQEVLIFAGVEKFNKELFFIIKNKNRNLSLYRLYCFDPNSEISHEFMKVADLNGGLQVENNCQIMKFYAKKTSIPNLWSVPEFKWSFEKSRIIDVWKHSSLTLRYWNIDFHPKNSNYIKEIKANPEPICENIPISNVKHSDFLRIYKTFHSIMSKNTCNEENKGFSNGSLISSFNPGHTTLLPADIVCIASKNFRTKNAKESSFY